MEPNSHDGAPRPWWLSRAKFDVPALPRDFVQRIALRERIGRTPVTTVCAPAGYGKTLLLADWARAGDQSRTAWVSLDDDDNDPDRFFSAVLSALSQCAAVPPDSALRTLRPRRGDDAASFVADVVDALDALPREVCLVLDDVHELTGVATLHGLATLVRHQPATLSLVLAGRRDPPLPLARLRVQGRLTDLTAAELRFGADEADALLRAAGVVLDDEQLAGLVEQTDGWVAGLRLAARSLPAAPDREAFLAGFVVEDRAVADYLGGEVLDGLAADVRDFLRAISVCDTVTPPLAGALSRRSDAGMLLDELADNDALVTAAPSPQPWYRVHPLLREHLRAGLRRQAPEEVVALHTTAALWYASHASPHEALEHAGRTEDGEIVADMLRVQAVELLLRGDLAAVFDGLAAAGAPRVRGDAWLSLVAALAHVEAGELDAAESALADSEAAWPADAGAELGALWRLVLATHALVCGRPPGPVDQEELPVSSALPWAGLVKGGGLLFEGETIAARRELSAALRASRERGLSYLATHCLTALGAAAALDGDYPAMRQWCAEAVAIAAEHDWRGTPLLAPAHLMLGFAALLAAEPAAALGHAGVAAAAVGEVPQARLRHLTGALRGAALSDEGHHTEGLRGLRGARGELGDVTLPPQAAALTTLLEYRAAMTLGHEPPDVGTWLRSRTAAPGECALLAAWAHAARGEPDAARRAAREAATAPSVLSGLTAVEALVLETELALRAGERTRARRCLGDALTLAERQALIRPFALADASVRQLLADQLGGFAHAEPFAERVHRALAELESAHAEGLLTGREHVVLARLGTHQSLSEVASGLSVSVNTVKTHVRAIYGKLGVNNRRAAVVAARERGLT
ncbi:LuxR C-terminal-related transcriptional regulator [Prauserella cavernicola]|uniref:AAA family ATPase n=1 Tax=Prauserella cavernicola TaxID=2800127 RepID=A0A934QWU6_9PSEU|nr:LuxR C-terminal-related transcriptional regulator [Prauserella cavernicola]MBK1787024.1 AAA family ATPase [Prauserella cavernicola]